MGEVFAGRFELLDLVAEGGMGSVWRVRDHKDGQTYAGKVLRQSDATGLLRFMREQSTRIHHPHVVTPLSWAGEDDRVMFTMPLVRGGSVATLLGDFGALPADWTVRLLDQTLDALGAVHAAGVVHRDVKPANLLLHPTGDAEPHLLLTDFGIAVPDDLPRMTRASQVIGSPGYMSAEQLQGADPHPGHDLHAVGIVGLEMMTGTRPPLCRQLAEQLAMTDTARRPLLELLLDAASEDPLRRPADAAAFRARLAAVPLLPTSAPDEERPFVFDVLDPRTDDAAATVTTSAQRPTLPPMPAPAPAPARGAAAPSVARATRPDPRHDPGRGRRVPIALLLLAVALACLAAMVLLLAG